MPSTTTVKSKPKCKGQNTPCGMICLNPAKTCRNKAEGTGKVAAQVIEKLADASSTKPQRDPGEWWMDDPVAEVKPSKQPATKDPKKVKAQPKKQAPATNQEVKENKPQQPGVYTSKYGVTLTQDEFSSDTVKSWDSYRSSINPASLNQETKTLLDNNRSVQELFDLMQGENSVSFKDEKGNPQAFVSYTSKQDCVYIDLLATAPWNLGGIPQDSRAVKGAGSTAIAAMIEESKKQGFGGKLRLGSLANSVSFYQAVGFKLTGEQGNMMELSPEDAEKFLKKFLA